MPAWRLDGRDCTINHLDVGARYASEDFVGHAVLCLAEPPKTVNVNSAMIATIHMGPPLEAGSQSLDIIGTAFLESDTLALSARRQIKVFVDDRLSERKAQESRLSRLRPLERCLAEYIIHPSCREPDADVSLWRFNCAGFVLRAYEEADIQLIDANSLPSVSLELLKRAYPRYGKLLDHAEYRGKLGLTNGEAWPVLLVGYVVNSLNRSPDVIRSERFVVKPGDEFFPSKSHGSQVADKPIVPGSASTPSAW